jgi:hypothetical protein
MKLLNDTRATVSMTTAVLASLVSRNATMERAGRGDCVCLDAWPQFIV